MSLPVHLSWQQTPSGRQIWTIHLTPNCADSCNEKIWNWQPVPVFSQGKRMLVQKR